MKIQLSLDRNSNPNQNAINGSTIAKHNTTLMADSPINDSIASLFTGVRSHRTPNQINHRF